MTCIWSVSGPGIPQVPSWGSLRRTSASSSVSSVPGVSTFPRSASRSSNMSYQEQSTPDRSDILNAVLAAGDACSSGEQETVVFSDVKMEPVQASASPSRPNTVDQVNIFFILLIFVV